MSDLSYREALWRKHRGILIRLHHDAPWDQQEFGWKPARWHTFRSWHPAVLSHPQAWWRGDRRHVAAWLCTGDRSGGSDHHEQLLYIRWWPAPGRTKSGVLARAFRFRWRVIGHAIRSWWFDSEGFRGIFGPWELVKDRGGPWPDVSPSNLGGNDG